MTTIVHLIQQLSLGGAGRAVIATSKYAARQGPFRFKIISLLSAVPEAIALAKAAGVTVVDAPEPAALRHELAEADLVQVSWWNSPEMQSLLQQGLPPARLLLWYHVAGDGAPQIITRELVDLADLNVTTNPWSAAELPVFGGLAPGERAQRVSTVYGSADFERLHGLRLQPHPGFNVGCIGTLDFVKLHRHFVSMSAAVRVPDIRFLLCGGGGAVEILLREAAQLGAADRFKYLGYVRDIKSVLEVLDVYGCPVCPGTYASSELTLQEVMFAGIVPVVFPYGGLRSLVQHEKTGLVVNTAQEYTQAIEYLYHQPEARQRLGRAAQDYARQFFGAENAARMLVPLYERLLAQPKRKRLWGCRRNQPLLEQSVGLFDVLDVPAFGQQARLFATSLGEAGAPFVTSLTSSSLPAILKAEEAISKVSSLVKSRFAGGVLNYRDAFPQDAFLRLWAGLALCGEGCHLEAISEFRTAQDLGYDHWRLSFYIAQAAAQLGEWFLVHHAIGAVLRVRPDFEPATALLALSRQRFQPALPASVPGPTTQPARPPRVTAIVSAYNSERFLRGCLEDLEAQTIAHELEIIVVDTASPQNERALVTEFQQRYSNIVYIRTEQRETVYGAWNRGLQAAHAPYVTNANTDDRHRPDALEKLAANLDAHPEITLVYADCLITRTENERFETAHPVGRFQWLDFDPQALLSRGCFVGPQPMWRRQVHEEHGYFDAQFVSAGDYEFWLRLAQNRKFLHVKETLGLYLESPTSVEHSSQDRVKREVPMAQDRYKKVLLAPAGTAIPFKPPQALPQPMEGRTRKAASIVLPPCALVGHLGAAKELIRQSRFPAAWEHTLTALKTRPFHPEAFLLLAEIALAAGNGEAARRSAQHARDIAPDFKPARQFLKGKLRGNAKPQWLVLPEALSAKDQAPRLSVCVIAKNEEQFLGRCLASVKGLADQIVVVDTGSTDRTVEIAKEHGAEIHSFSWTDDFSAARNSALEHVTGDWVLVLDADEELVPESHEALRKLISAAAVMAWRLPIVDMGVEEEGCSYVPRLFRNAPALFFVGRVHEQVFSSIEVRRREWGLDNRLGDAQLRHYGYTAQLVKDRDKITRNLRLLEKAIEELPDEPSLLMNYGLELTRSGDRPQGLEQYRRAFQLMGSQPPARVVPELREMLLSQFATQLTAGQHFEELISALTSPLARQGGLTASQHFSLGLALIETRQFAEAAEHMRQCLAKRSQPVLSPINKDIRKAGPAHCLALCLSQLQDPAGASEAFRRAMSEDPNSRAVRSDYARFLVAQKQPVEALQLYHALVAEQPNDEAAWLAGGQLALSHPEFLEVALDWTSEAMQKHPKHATVLAQRAEALLLAGRAEEAVVAWRETQPAQNPTALGALVLCETASNRNSPPPPAELEPAISQEFLRWYQRLVRYGAGALLTQVNARLDTLRTILPSAARVLTSALAEANTEPQGAER